MGNFSKNLRHIRRSKDLTLMQLAEMTGICLSQLSNYERGISNPNILYFEWLCKALDVPSKDLLGF